MNHANATRAANCPDDRARAEPVADDTVGADHDSDAIAVPLIWAPPPEDLTVALAYLCAELSHDFFRLVHRRTGGRHD